MSKASMLLGIALAGICAVSGTAQARYISDTTLVQPYNGLSPVGSGGYSHWMDLIGSDNPFQVYGVDVNTSSANGGTVNLSIYTNYAPPTETSFHTRTADIAFKLTGDAGFDHGIVLFNHGGVGAIKDDNTLGAGFYGNTTWKTSQDFFGDNLGDIYSGMAAVCTDDTTCNAASPTAIDTYITDGTLLGGHNLTVTLKTSAADTLTPDDDDIAGSQIVQALYRIDVSMTGVGSLFGPNWEMVFGNATCGNDTIIVTGVGIRLPEPAPVGLLLLGLVGLGVARRKTKST